MKRILLLPLAALALTGCVVEFYGGWYGGARYPRSYSGARLHVDELYFQSNYTLNGQPIVCDDRPTSLSYGFHYSGDLSWWRSRLVGKTSGAETGDQIFYNGTPYPGVNYGSGQVTVTYNVPARTAPLAVGDQMTRPQSIVVEPGARVIGYTALRLTATTSDGDSGTVELPEIPVVENCP